MSRNAKPDTGQGATAARHGWARGLAESALGEAKGAFVRAGFTDATLVLRWAEIAGPSAARITRPFKWQEDKEGATLTLKCEPGAIVLLQHQTRELIDRVNAYLGHGRVARLRLVPGRLETLPEPPPHPAPQTDSPLPEPGLPGALTRLAEARVRLKRAPRKRFAPRPD